MHFNHLDPAKNDEIFGMYPPRGCRWVMTEMGPMLRLSNQGAVGVYLGASAVVIAMGTLFYFMLEDAGGMRYLFLGFLGIMLALLIYSVIWSLRFQWISFGPGVVMIGNGIFKPKKWEYFHLGRVKIQPVYEKDDSQALLQVFLNEYKSAVFMQNMYDRKALLDAARAYFSNTEAGRGMLSMMQSRVDFEFESWLASLSDDRLRSVLVPTAAKQYCIAMVRSIEQHQALCDYLNQLIQIHISALTVDDQASSKVPEPISF